MLWISVTPSIVKLIELGCQEWSDVIFVRYSIDPPDLPHSFDRCGAQLSITHTMEFCDGATELYSKVFVPLHVHDKPIIHTSFLMQDVKT